MKTPIVYNELIVYSETRIWTYILASAAVKYTGLILGISAVMDYAVKDSLDLPALITGGTAYVTAQITNAVANRMIHSNLMSRISDLEKKIEGKK